MRRPPLCITSNDELFARYQELAAGDCVVGRVRLRPSEENLLLDLRERGVRFVPSALSQLASRSKTLQARLFASFMLPHTVAIHDLHDLLEAVTSYNRHNIGRVVSKHDRSNGGMGILLWNSAEEVYSRACCNSLPLPFVLQPFLEECCDMRLVILGDYQEAYWRRNPHNFRNNLHCGGESQPCSPSAEQLALCQQVMARGRFPYAHIDLLVNGNGTSYLGEINLRGGIRGAAITPRDYRSRIEAIHRRLVENFGEMA